MLLLLAAGSSTLTAQDLAPELAALPVVEITSDNVRIDRSCRLVVPRGTKLHDADSNGIVHIVADDITVVMDENSGWLNAAGWAQSPDQREGIALRIDGRANVTLIGLRIRGFGVGISAENTAGLIIDAAQIRDGFGRPLILAGEASDSSDRGTAIILRDAVAPTIRNTTIRTFQRGIWARSAASPEFFDNDISYLSGDAITLIDAPDAIVSNNIIDGLYAGDDRQSVGVLLYGNSNNALIAQNAMRGLGEHAVGISIGSATSQPQDRISGGLIIANHITGSETAIQAVGTQNTVIASNIIDGATTQGILAMGATATIGANTITAGQIGVRAEGTEHIVRENTLSGQHTAVRVGGSGTLVRTNTIDNATIGVLADPRASVNLGPNSFEQVEQELSDQGATTEQVAVTMEIFSPPDFETPGQQAASEIAPTAPSFSPRVDGDFFPWDGQSVQLRRLQRDGRRHVFEVYGGSKDLWATIRSREASVEWTEGATPSDPVRFAVNGPSGVHPYELRIAERDRFDRRFSGTLLRARWRIDVFEWQADPVSDADTWRSEAQGERSRRARTTDLQYDFADQGPSEQSISGAVIRAGFPNDRFGIIATTMLPLTEGTYEIVARIGPDDGVRLLFDGQLVAETWTTPESSGGEARARVTIEQARDVEVTVEFADRSGHARLDLSIELPEEVN